MDTKITESYLHSVISQMLSLALKNPAYDIVSLTHEVGLPQYRLFENDFQEEAEKLFHELCLEKELDDATMLSSLFNLDEECVLKNDCALCNISENEYIQYLQNFGDEKIRNTFPQFHNKLTSYILNTIHRNENLAEWAILHLDMLIDIPETRDIIRESVLHQKAQLIFFTVVGQNLVHYSSYPWIEQLYTQLKHDIAQKNVAPLRFHSRSNEIHLFRNIESEKKMNFKNSSLKEKNKTKLVSVYNTIHQSYKNFKKNLINTKKLTDDEKNALHYPKQYDHHIPPFEMSIESTFSLLLALLCQGNIQNLARILNEKELDLETTIQDALKKLDTFIHEEIEVLDFLYETLKNFKQRKIQNFNIFISENSISIHSPIWQKELLPDKIIYSAKNGYILKPSIIFYPLIHPLTISAISNIHIIPKSHLNQSVPQSLMKLLEFSDDKIQKYIHATSKPKDFKDPKEIFEHLILKNFLEHRYWLKAH